MSSWWNIEITAIGDFARVKELEAKLEPTPEDLDDGYAELFGKGAARSDRPFHIVQRVERHGGFITISASENYGGENAIRALVAQYPDLVFIGLFAHDYPERYFQFEGRAGEMAVREYPLPPD